MGRPTQFIQLKPHEKDFLNELVRKGEMKSKELNRSRILLWNDEKKKSAEIATLLRMSYTTVTQTLKCYRDEGLESALYDADQAEPPARSRPNWRHTLLQLPVATAPRVELIGQ